MTGILRLRAIRQSINDPESLSTPPVLVILSDEIITD
jgi:hypothetical protein